MSADNFDNFERSDNYRKLNNMIFYERCNPDITN